MLQWRGSEVSVHDVTGLLVRLAYPLRELHGVWDSRRQKDVAYGMREKNNGLLPDDTTLFVSHIMDLIEYDPCYFAHDLGAAIEHGAQDLNVT